MRHCLLLSLALASAGCGLIDSVSGPKALSIQKFQASPEEVSSGSSVTLSWEVEGAEQVAIQGIGNVPPRGSRSFPAYVSATYTLTARAGTSSATSTVSVTVRGSGSFPDPLPTPSPSPSATPTPEPSPSPTPTPDPTPTPGPAGACGVPAPSAVKGCDVDWENPVGLPDGQCIELNTLTVDQACPVSDGTNLAVGFSLTARTALQSLSWRLGRNEKDTVTPSQGPVDVNGQTSVFVSDTVGLQWVVFEVVDQDDNVRLRFRLKHR